MTIPLLEVENISKFFPGVKALQGVELSVDKGEIHALIGENGAGKSTLIKVLSGVYQPEEGGRIAMEGEELGTLNPLTSLNHGIVVIYQDFSLFPNLSVLENITLGRYVEQNKKLVNYKEMRKVASKILKQLDIDNIGLDESLGDRSVARQQLVAIARALANDAKLLILDEPTSSLSSSEVEKLFDIMFALKGRGISMLFISHKLDEVYKVSDRLSILRDGRYIGTFNSPEIGESEVIALMVGRQINYTIYPKRRLETPLLEVRSFSKQGNYKDINFTLHQGEVLGITGLVGAGRTEVVKSIFGLNPEDEGVLLLNGEEIKIKNPTEAMENGIAFIPENRLSEGLVLRKSTQENLTLTLLEELSNRLGLINQKRSGEVVTTWIDKLDIRPSNPSLFTAKLSGGNQQRVVIAKWLATSPKILIVDEPTNGIDVGAKAEIHRLLRELAQSGLGIIVVSSELPEILAICDRVVVMKRGRVTAQLFCEGLSQEDIMSRAI
ncbi:MAG: sugar ABC transporter ATP-binding protein [Sphaerochaetaceae bacterium]|nr:sugar ABC transporter ATP-binding protein [Sphaerochaetaceae bacterium]